MHYILLLIKDNYTEAPIKLTDKEHLYFLLYLNYKITF